MRVLRVLVVGAGAFGGWTALQLLRHGARVTLIDAWGPGNARASSGGETRVIRATYGARAHYTAMALEALNRWRHFDRQCQQQLLHEIGVLWMFDRSSRATEFARASVNALRSHGYPVEDLPPPIARRRYPQVNFEGVVSTFIEPRAGYLMARRACDIVVQHFIAEGGAYEIAAATVPVVPGRGGVTRLALRDGRALEADAFVFACGPWLGAIFPDVLGAYVSATRQEVYYFGSPGGDAAFTDRGLPVWIEYGDTQMYGIPGNAHRGFKVADDAPGVAMDPTTAERDPSVSGIQRARSFVAVRFPRLADAPLIGAEVCQYENSPDAEFIIDRHPSADNVWIVGGGSGHGFKMGPVVGELAAGLVLGTSRPDARFGLERLRGLGGNGWIEKWT
jgi:glycine/D-amino acid oxidase-like deaminating enzyme